MKSDVITAAVTAVISAAIAYFICGMFLPGLEDVSFPVLQGEASYTLSDPDVEVFNYRAINPTVEVYVGDCTEYDSAGNCLDYDKIEDQAEEEVEDIVDETEEESEEGETEKGENSEGKETENGATN